MSTSFIEKLRANPDWWRRPELPLPLVTCNRCGSKWFREMPVVLIKQEHAELVGIGDLQDVFFKDRQDRLYGSIRVCLCGRPVRPDLSKFLWSETVQAQMASFLDAFDGALKYQDRAAGFEKRLERAVAEVWGEKDRLVAAATHLRGMEEKVLDIVRRYEAGAVVGLKKPWKEIGRSRESQAVGRDQIVLDLQAAGFTYRIARAILKTVVESCVAGLKADRHLDTPIGIFRVVAAPPEREGNVPDRRRFNASRKVVKFAQRERVRFELDPGLKQAVNTGWLKRQKQRKTKKLKETPKEIANRKLQQLLLQPEGLEWCNRCGSEWLTVAEFRRYLKHSASSPGGDFWAADDIVFRAPVCVCGNMNPPRYSVQLKKSGLPEFLSDLEAAVRYRQHIESVENLVAAATKKAAGRNELEQLEQRLTEMENQLEMLGKSFREQAKRRRGSRPRL